MWSCLLSKATVPVHVPVQNYLKHETGKVYANIIFLYTIYARIINGLWNNNIFSLKVAVNVYPRNNNTIIFVIA